MFVLLAPDVSSNARSQGLGASQHSASVNGDKMSPNSNPLQPIPFVCSASSGAFGEISGLSKGVTDIHFVESGLIRENTDI